MQHHLIVTQYYGAESFSFGKKIHGIRNVKRYMKRLRNHKENDCEVSNIIVDVVTRKQFHVEDD